MLLGFQGHFGEPVRTGVKRQTIRAKGKRPVPKVGALAYCYTALRTPFVRALGVWLICKVDELQMEITCDGLDHVRMNGVPLGHAELERLATADGFDSFLAMQQWFLRNHSYGPFEGWVVSWDWSLAGAAIAPGRAQ